MVINNRSTVNRSGWGSNCWVWSPVGCGKSFGRSIWCSFGQLLDIVIGKTMKMGLLYGCGRLMHTMMCYCTRADRKVDLEGRKCCCCLVYSTVAMGNGCCRCWWKFQLRLNRTVVCESGIQSRSLYGVEEKENVCMGTGWAVAFFCRIM